MKTQRLSLISSAVVLALGLTTSAMAAETSSGISGKILNPAGTAAANTTITVTHIPTGIKKTVTTNASGSYNLRGLKVGGPYKVVIDSEQYKDQEHNDIFLTVGKPLRLSADLQADDIERIQVTGSGMIGYTNKGSSGSWGSDEIINAAGGNRDLKDVLRANPLVTVSTDSDASMSIAGSNPRFNSFTVDGVKQNDDFGLNGNGYPTQRSPISIDAIAQVSVETTPFSARNGGFSGGQINAVTKSGANELFGSFSWERDSSDWAGTPKNLEGEDVDLDFESTTYAATLGGAIVEDKLFFFLSYENFDAPTQVEFGPEGSNAANKTNATLAEYERVRQISQSVYGVDVGTWDAQPEQTDEKILVKIDWNINDEHRAAFTYQNTDGNVTRNMGTSDSELRLSSHWYNKSEKLQTLAAHLYSTWNDDFSSEIKLAWKDVDTAQTPNSKAMGDVTIDTEDGRIALGPDKYRHGNALTNETISFRALGEYLYNDHEISFGVEYESVDVMNLFAPDSLGVWAFDSIDDFEAQKADYMSYKNAYTNDVADAAATFKFSNLAFFIEDSFYITDDILLTAGLRYEQFNSSDAPSNNENFEARYGFSNSTNLDGESLLLPRINAEWEVSDVLTVTAGTGLFSGGQPNVWLSNSYSNDGITYVSAGNEWQHLDNADITSVPQAVKDDLQSGDGNTNVTDPNFKLPTDWRTSVGFDYSFTLGELANDWFWSAEFIYIDRKDDVFWRDLTREHIGETAGGRKIYEPIDKLTGETTDRYDLMLTNASDGGRSKIFTTSLSTTFDNGFGFNASYANQDITEGTSGNSSQATSNFKYPVTTDRNRAEIGTGYYEVEHSFKLNLNYTHEFVENYATKFNLFFERRSGRPISWLLSSYKDGHFGDSDEFYGDNAYLPYIPSGADDPNVVYKYTNYEEFKALLDQTGLSKYAGGYAPKGSARSPWQTRMDLNITQELPGFSEGHKGEFFINIRNFLNMIDHSKGRSLRSQYGTHSLTDWKLDSEGRYEYSPVFGGFNGANYSMIDAEKSAWSIKMGVRYKF